LKPPSSSPSFSPKNLSAFKGKKTSERDQKKEFKGSIVRKRRNIFQFSLFLAEKKKCVEYFVREKS
jgi:hypothetical protein